MANTNFVSTVFQAINRAFTALFELENADTPCALEQWKTGRLKTPGTFPDARPSFNIDGTPMLGEFDVKGNPYGVIQDVNDPTWISSDDPWDGMQNDPVTFFDIDGD